MADPWRPTLRKRLILASLDLLGHVAPGIFSGGDRNSPANADVREILVIELWNIGDLVLTMPFLAQIRAKFPAAKITLLARGYARDVLGGTGLVDDYVVTELGWGANGGRRSFFPYRLGELWRVGRELHRRHFDVAFQSRMHVRERVLLALANARRKVGYAMRERDSVLTDALPAAIERTHKVEDWLGLLAPFGGAMSVTVPMLRPAADDARWAIDFLAAAGVSGTDVLVGVHPGASVMEKRWPLDRFVAVARWLAARAGTQVIAFSDSEGYGASLGSEPGVILAADLTLNQLIALLARCRLLICNDSGPMHLAAAMGIPVAAVFGAGIDRWFSPLGSGHSLITAAKGDSHDGIGGGVGNVSVESVIAIVADKVPRR